MTVVLLGAVVVRGVYRVVFGAGGAGIFPAQPLEHDRSSWIDLVL